VAWRSFEVPDVPEPHQVIVKTARSLISAGTEIAIYSGSHIGFSIPNPPEWLKFPIGQGYALTGTVQGVGAQVESWAVGDRVLTSARHGDWAVCDVRAEGLYHLPDGISMEQGALARLGGISLVGVRQGKVVLGETVVVLGQGLIGQFAAQLSRVAGARPVVGVDLIPHRLEVAATHAIQPVNPTETDVAQMVREATGGRMADVVIEATGNPGVMQTALDLAAEGGRVVLLGSLRGKVKIDAYSTIHRKGVTLIGAHDRLSDHPQTPSDAWTRERNLQLVMALLADGSLATNGLVSHHIQPDEIRGTYEALIERPSDFLGVIVDWAQDER
jgi:2-desacetyl-2-hydroxyethyl bacteriochlorophyllide A dehydrogenase